MVFRQGFDSEQERSDCTQERRCRLLEKPTAHSLACSRFAPVLNRARFPQILVAALLHRVLCVSAVTLWLGILETAETPADLEDAQRVNCPLGRSRKLAQETCRSYEPLRGPQRT